MAKKIILYGSAECPPCIETKKRLDEAGIRYGYVDVLGGLAHLKKFMSFRDAHYDIYKNAIAEGSIGIPTVVIDDKDIYVDEVTSLDISVFQ
ncbi:glutaredoxin [Tyzzerella sp. OttesenSCG-928-J15]|nr:glutaredoxin [Tyzzerella sp. OttesenSCG-928-J15]